MIKMLDDIFIFGSLLVLFFFSVTIIYGDNATPTDGIIVAFLKHTKDQIYYYTTYILWIFSIVLFKYILSPFAYVLFKIVDIMYQIGVFY